MKVVDGKLRSNALENFMVFAHQHSRKPYPYEGKNVVMKNFHFWRVLIFGFALITIAVSFLPSVPYFLVFFLLGAFFILTFTWLLLAKCELEETN